MLAQHKLRRKDSNLAKRRYEFRFVGKGGETRNILLFVDLVPGTKKSIVSLLDITDRKHAEEAMLESEKRYRMIADNMTETVTVMDLSMKFTYISPSVKALRGFSVEEAMQQSLEDVLTPESLSVARARFDEEISREMEGSADPDRSITLDLEEYCRDGSTIWANNTLKFLRDEDGRPVSILTVSRDITEQKQSEMLMRENEEKFRTIFESSPYPIAINSDPEFAFLEVNKAFLDVSGYSEEEVIGKNPHELGLLSMKEVTRLVSRRLFSGKIENVPLALTVKDGKRVHVLFSTIPVTINNKPAMLTLTAEVTKLKKVEEELLHKNEELNAAYEQLAATEEELRQNYEELTKSEAELREGEEKLRALVEYSLDGILITDFSGHLLFANRSAGDIIETSDYKALIGKINVLDFVAPESRADVMKDIGNVAAGKDAYMVHYKLLTEKGGERWVECIGKKIRFGDSGAMLVSMRDVTGRKEAEVQLRESEKKFSSVFQGSPVALTLVSTTDGRFVEVNDAFLQNTGYSRGEVIGRTADDLGIFIDAQERQRLLSSLRQQEPVRNLELNCRLKSGETRACLFSSSVISLKGVPHILSTIQDITERKVAEEVYQVMVRGMVGTTGLSSLQKIAENMSSWLNVDCVMIGMIQPDNETVKTLSMILDGEPVYDFSYSLKGTPCENVAEKGFCIYPDDAATLFPESKDLADLNVRGYLGTPLRNSRGNVIGIMCAMSRSPLTVPQSIQEYLDLVAVKVAAELERLIMEREIQESRYRLAEAMDLADLVAWECDVPNELFTFDDRFYALYGTTAEREGGTRMSAETYAREFVHPDDRHLVAEEMEKARQTDNPDFVSQIEHRIVRRDGEIRYISVRFGVTLNERGRTIRTHGATQDITERKRAEDALRQAHRQIKILTGITRHDILNSIMAAEGYLHLVREGEPAQQAEYLDKIHRIIEKIHHQIEFTREYENLGSKDPIWQNLGSIIRRLEIPEPITLETNGINREIYADPMLWQVFENLLDNTLRHGGHVTTILVSGRPLDGGLRITWEDNGIGIPEDEKDRIFNRGYGKNTGLGLFFAREILSLTNISIRETGEPGKGAVFEILVPSVMFRE